MSNNASEAKGFYKLNWMQRIGFGAGDMAQNLIYQTVSIWLLFFYTNVFGLKPGPAALMFLVVRLVDVLWDPVVGTIVDKSNPKWGKYRSWLVFGGVPLVGLAILCFWNGLSGASDMTKLIYAYVTYVGMSMCYTLVNVPYGALNASLTRDTNEITILTSTRMFMANLGGLIVKSLPIIIAIFAPKVLNEETGKMVAVYNTPEAGGAWFITYAIFAIVGLALLFFCFSQCKERVVMDAKESANVKVSDLWMEFGRNKPLRIVAFFFITAFAMMSVSNAADAYFMSYNVEATPLLTTLFMWLGTIPAFIFMPLVPAIKRKIGKKGMFYLFLGVAICGMAMMYTFVSIPATKTNFVLLCIAQFVKSTGIITATGYMWALVPEVIAYGEYTSGKRIAGIVNALTGIFFKAGMALGGVVPGLVLAWVGFNADAAQQTPLALQGILWLVCVIPAILLLLAIFIISKYELSDEKMDQINKEIEARQLAE
ncbi:MAG: MFS transporter [Bacteroidales bacterium]|nr:MFS transporter [Bacteroidales bacterium]